MQSETGGEALESGDPQEVLGRFKGVSNVFLLYSVYIQYIHQFWQLTEATITNKFVTDENEWFYQTPCLPWPLWLHNGLIRVTFTPWTNPLQCCNRHHSTASMEWVALVFVVTSKLMSVYKINEVLLLSWCAFYYFFPTVHLFQWQPHTVGQTLSDTFDCKMLAHPQKNQLPQSFLYLGAKLSVSHFLITSNLNTASAEKTWMQLLLF